MEARVTYLDEFPPHREASTTLRRLADADDVRRVASFVRRALRGVRRIPAPDPGILAWQGRDPGHGRVLIVLYERCRDVERDEFPAQTAAS